MSVGLLLVLLLSPGEIDVLVEGSATHVIAYRDGLPRAQAPVVDGRARLRALAQGEYDLIAVGPLEVSHPLWGVRALPGRREHEDARLVALPAFPIDVDAPAGTRLIWEGLSFALGELRLPAGIHRISAEHPERVPFEGRLVRVSGPTRVALDLDPGLVVTGLVRGLDGAPLAGAMVDVFVDGEDVGRVAFTDGEGRFGVGGFRGAVVSIRVRAIGAAQAMRRAEFLPGEERARVEVDLRPGSCASVVVAGGGGQASALLMPEWQFAARGHRPLRANGGSALLRGGRRFHFSGLLPGERYRTNAWTEVTRSGHAEEFEAPAAGTTAIIPLKLEPLASIRGLVEGEGAAGALVACDLGSRLTCRADGSGRFAFEGLQPGEYHLRLVDLDARADRITLAPGQQVERNLKAPSPVELPTLRGLVTDADGKPLEGVVVRCGAADALSGSEGRFELRGVPRGLHLFRVALTPGPTCRAFEEDPHLPYVDLKARSDGLLAVRLERAGTLRLRLESDGRPLAQATLLLASMAGSLRRELALRRGRDVVEVVDLPVGGYVAEVKAPGFARAQGANVTARPVPGEPEPLRIPRGRTLSGRLFLREGRFTPLGTPQFIDTEIDRATVRLVDGDLRGAPAATAVDADGSFRLGGLPVGSIVVCAFGPGFPPTLFPFDLTKADLEGAELPLQRGVEASVRVTDSAGNPVAPGEWQIFTEQGFELRALVVGCRFGGCLADDADIVDFRRLLPDVGGPGGRIVLPFLAPGSYRLRIRADGFEQGEIGIRAYTAWQIAQIRALPLEGVPQDLEPYLRLTRLP